MTPTPSDAPLAFAHIGDLHITDANAPNFTDLMSIIAQIETQARDQLDFVVLPGDCADHGQPGQYALIATALRMLSIPVHIIPGDHDMEPGDLANFYAGLGARQLPYAESLKGYRCLFLDFCSQGSGGPDFRLGTEQLSWLETELKRVKDTGEIPVLFVHGYPADLRDDEEAKQLTQLIAEYGVAFVDMGHTHYNELANDGTTIYAATRSTGQIDEGPVGYSIATLDRGVVSWRFRPLDDPFPFVMITSPADHRLLRGDAQKADKGSDVRARVFGRDTIAEVKLQVEDGEWVAMDRVDGGPDWHGSLHTDSGRLIDVAVMATTTDGRPGVHAIRAAGATFQAAPKAAPGAARGSDAATIGLWPENGIFGTQLGPNRNGRKW